MFNWFLVFAHPLSQTSPETLSHGKETDIDLLIYNIDKFIKTEFVSRHYEVRCVKYSDTLIA